MTISEAELILDVIEDSIVDLDNLSCENDDVFASEVEQMYELVKRCRKSIN